MVIESTRAQGLGARTLRGMLWAYGSFVGVRLTTLIATAILARLLVPSDFGLVAVATTFMAFLEMVQGLGVGQALVIASDRDVDEQADTAFTLSVALGAVLSVMAAALGPAAAAFFHQPQLVTIMPVLGSTFFIGGISSTHYALAMRNIDFRSRTVAELVYALARGFSGIALALAGAGVWSLILGYLVGEIAMSAILWRLVPWRPRRMRSLRHVRNLLSFGGYVTGVSVMAAFLAQFDNLVVGRSLGTTQLGYYSIATKVPMLFILSIAAVAGQVLFPAFATLDGDTLRRGVITSFRYTAMIVFPLTAFLIVLAAPIMLVVFGPHWNAAVPAAQVLCLWAMMSPISMVSGNAFLSRGRARLLFALAIPQAVALVAGSIALVPYGIVAVSWVQAAIAIAAQVITLGIAQRLFRLSAGSLITAFGPPLLASTVLAGTLFALDRLIVAPWLVIVGGAAAGGIVYLLTLQALAPDLIPAAGRMIRTRGGEGWS
jgi:polysaccharide transporter, PST family